MNSTSVPKTNKDNHQHHQNQPHHHYDVFFARGHGVDKSPGNKIYRSMIRTHHHAYKTCNNTNMHNEIVKRVIQPIISAGGKFYSQTKGAGSTTTTNKNNTGKRNQELSHRELIKKVKQSLRDCKGPTDATSSSKSSNEMTTSSSIIADATISSSDAMILNRNHEQTKMMVISPLQHQDVPKEDISSYSVSIHAYHTTDNQVCTDMPNNHHQQQQQQPQNNYEPLPHTTSGSMIYEQEDSTMMTNMIIDDTTQTSSQQTQSRDDDLIETIMNCSVGSFLVPDLLTSVSNIWEKEDDSRIFLGESFQFNNESVTRMGSNTSSSLIDDLKDILMDE